MSVSAFAPAFVATFVVASYADRRDRRKLMIATDLARVAVVAVASVLLSLNLLNLPLLVATTALLALIGAPTRDAGGRAAEFAEEAQGLAGGDGLREEGADLGMGTVDGLPAGGEAVPSAAAKETDRVTCTLVALVCQQLILASASASMMPCSRAARTSWTAPAKAGEAHIRRPFGSAMTCTFMPCFLCLPK